VMGLKHSVMGLSPSWPQCGYATIQNSSEFSVKSKKKEENFLNKDK
jgi:hypothetical protein